MNCGTSTLINDDFICLNLKAIALFKHLIISNFLHTFYSFSSDFMCANLLSLTILNYDTVSVEINVKLRLLNE